MNAAAAVEADGASRDKRLALLAESAPLYAGRSAAEAERLRAEVLGSFAIGPGADDVLPFALEQIDSGHDPFALAAAAKVLRNTGSFPPDVGLRLVNAIARMRSLDCFVEADNADGRPRATMLTELAEALGHVLGSARANAADAAAAAKQLLGGARLHPRVRSLLDRALAGAGEAAKQDDAACCCSMEPPPLTLPMKRPRSAPAAARMQDQDGREFSFGSFFEGRRSVVAFFYTRCENPQKCSATVHALAALQRLIRADPALADVGIAAISYDPAFDTPERLKAYGRDRGVEFDAHTRLMRTRGAFEPLVDFFDLGVSYGPTTVSLHRLELTMLDRGMHTAARLQRQRWQPEQVVDLLHGLPG